MTPKEKILVLIVSYRTSNLMQALVDSIQESSVDVSILILDNASTRESFDELNLLTDQRVTLLRSEQNLGFTGGINFALKHGIADGQNYKYLFLMNPDAFSSRDLLGNLAAVLRKDPLAAGVSPKIMYLNGEPWYTGGLINYRQGRVLNSSPSRTRGANAVSEVDVFSGCAVLFDLEKLIRAGMFSEKLFMYFDEAELSIRLKSLGYRILYSPYLKIYHDVSYTTRNISHLKTYYMTRNKFMVFNNTMSFSNKVYFLLYELAFHVKNKRAKNALYHLKGYYDFLRGKTGAYESA